MNVRKLAIRLDQFLAASPVLRQHTRGWSENVFFPGCSLMGYNPGYVFRVRDFLANYYGQCGICSGCCAKPLKLLGESGTFTRSHEKLARDFDAMGAKRIITACQNCYSILTKAHSGLEVLSLWPVMLKSGLPEGLRGKYAGLEAALQDSCSSTQEIAESVREILHFLGVKVHEFPGKRFTCCGGIAAITTNNGRQVMRARASKSPCNVIISYCASCRSAMSIDKAHKSIHVLDLIFGNAQSSRARSNLINRFITARNLNRR